MQGQRDGPGTLLPVASKSIALVLVGEVWKGEDVRETEQACAANRQLAHVP